jgi:hypothetical protein
MIFLRSARSDVKIRQNPPDSIGQISQKSARNLELFMSFFTPWGSVLWLLLRIWPNLKSGTGKKKKNLKKFLQKLFFLSSTKEFEQS